MKCLREMETWKKYEVSVKGVTHCIDFSRYTHILELEETLFCWPGCLIVGFMC